MSIITEKNNKRTKRLLITASVFTIMMAVPHFFVPFIFPWEQLVSDLYPPVQWALFAMNLFFSLLLLWGGIITLVAALKWTMSKSMRYLIYGGMALFWIIGSIYEIFVPFPMIEARWVLPIIALCIGCLYGIALFSNKEQ